jgi:1,4-dihydroxy-2-naphthoate octaprenyltransferase
MIGGTYLVATGTIPVWVLVFSLPYALLVTSVLFGKHIDKIVPDTALGIRTLPVILGDRLARRVAQVIMFAFYPLLALAVLVGWVGPWVALALLAIPELIRALRVFNQPHPAEPPSWYPKRGWPLWFVGFAFRHVRLAGFLMTVGLVLNALVPVKLPWL